MNNSQTFTLLLLFDLMNIGPKISTDTCLKSEVYLGLAIPVRVECKLDEYFLSFWTPHLPQSLLYWAKWYLRFKTKTAKWPDLTKSDWLKMVLQPITGEYMSLLWAILMIFIRMGEYLLITGIHAWLSVLCAFSSLVCKTGMLFTILMSALAGNSGL